MNRPAIASTISAPPRAAHAHPAYPAIPPRWRWHHRMLLHFRDRLLRQREDRSAAFHVALERNGADAGDVALAHRENLELLATIAAQDAELDEIEAALRRIEHGTYGICEATGREISPDRLRALPWTRFSKGAAALRENELPLHRVA